MQSSDVKARVLRSIQATTENFDPTSFGEYGKKVCDGSGRSPKVKGSKLRASTSTTCEIKEKPAKKETKVSKKKTATKKKATTKTSKKSKAASSKEN